MQRGFSLVQRGLCEFRLMSPQAVDLALGVPSLVMPGAPLVSLPAVRTQKPTDETDKVGSERLAVRMYK